MLSNIRSFLNFKKIGSFDLESCFLKNYYTPEIFRQRLCIEKRRIERINSHTSILIFNFKKVIDLLKEKELINSEIHGWIQLISLNVRETDAVCYDKPAKILILFPDTDYQGAQGACKRLLDKILIKMAMLKYNETMQINDLEVDIISYPEKLNEHSLPKEFIICDKTSSLSTGKSSNIAQNQNGSNVFIFKRDYNENLNLCCYSSNGTTLAMPMVNDLFFVRNVIDKFKPRLQKLLKRMIDLSGSISALILLSPVLFIISILIKMTSPGPIFFKQQRVGYRGKLFQFLKFRSMKTDCDCKAHEEYVKKLIQGRHQAINNGSADSPYFKMTNDPRITRLGHFLRKTSLDELPQLWNVIKGEMSLVGPRPPIPYELKEYQSWHRRRITEVKPGITGWWQVNGRNRIGFDEMVRLDIYYAENWSLLLDLKIILRTFKAVFDGN
jgi:lipopolysaccharide/colanic/teichoic acid biosynthesis glycosyltransferase